MSVGLLTPLATLQLFLEESFPQGRLPAWLFMASYRVSYTFSYSHYTVSPSVLSQAILCATGIGGFGMSCIESMTCDSSRSLPLLHLSLRPLH